MNSSRSLLVLGVTGQVGTLVAEHLKRSEVHFSVGTRRKANLEELAHQFGASRFIDLDDPRTFDDALKDITGLFLLTGYTVAMLVQSKSLIDAAKRNGVRHIVHLGAFTRDHDAYSTVFAWHQMIEAYLRDSGVAWTNLHPNMFMQNFLSVWSIKGGVYNAYTSKAVGFTALNDVAEAAAAILMEGPENHKDRKSTRLNSSHGYISYAVFCLKKKITHQHSSTILLCSICGLNRQAPPSISSIVGSISPGFRCLM